MNKILYCLCFAVLFNGVVAVASNRNDVSFNITIPARVVLTRDENGEYSGNYKVYATTDSYDTIEISPESDTIELTSSGKDSITAYVEQDVTTFDSSVSEATGRVYVTDNVSAGDYKGSFTFNISSIEIATPSNAELEINTEEETVIDKNEVESSSESLSELDIQEIESENMNIQESLSESEMETDESISESKTETQETESENIDLDSDRNSSLSEEETESQETEQETKSDESISESENVDTSLSEIEEETQRVENETESLSESEEVIEKELESDGESI